MKDVEISLNSTHIKPNEQILGNIKVNYTGRYDGIVIMYAYFRFKRTLYGMCNGKNVDKNVTRLFIPKDSMKNIVDSLTVSPEQKRQILSATHPISSMTELFLDIESAPNMEKEEFFAAKREIESGSLTKAK